MGAGVGVYPNGWDSTEVQQACGNISKSYSLGEFSVLTHYQMTNFRLFQIERLCKRQFKI